MYFDVSYLQGIVYAAMDVFPFAMLVGTSIAFVLFVLDVFLLPLRD